MWFDTADDMVCYLRSINTDPKKLYNLIDTEITAKLRAKKKVGHFIKGMTFLEDEISDDVYVGSFLIPEAEEESEELDEAPQDMVVLPMLYEVTEADSFVGLRSPPKSIELFFVVKVVAKNIAAHVIEDEFGHKIRPNEPYLHLDYKHQTKNYVQFGNPKNQKKAFIHIGEVFATNIELDDNLKMDISDYRSLSQELY